MGGTRRTAGRGAATSSTDGRSATTSSRGSSPSPTPTRPGAPPGSGATRPAPSPGTRTRPGPKSVERFGLVDGVWVCDAASAFPLTVALRASLLEVAAVRQSGVGQKSKMEQLYAYLTGPDFRRRVEAIVESFRSLKDDLETERRWLT
ncbi:MAG TPA: DUF2130 domain-containing protein, partial [Acidobacteriota bacterium]|nr:DUF2130 domain-containing protein [Acidobacteriota bacterium]